MKAVLLNHLRLASTRISPGSCRTSFLIQCSRVSFSRYSSTSPAPPSPPPPPSTSGPSTSDEITQLASTLNRLLVRLEELESRMPPPASMYVPPSPPPQQDKNMKTGVKLLIFGGTVVVAWWLMGAFWGTWNGGGSFRWHSTGFGGDGDHWEKRWEKSWGSFERPHQSDRLENDKDLIKLQTLLTTIYASDPEVLKKLMGEQNQREAEAKEAEVTVKKDNKSKSGKLW